MDTINVSNRKSAILLNNLLLINMSEKQPLNAELDQDHDDYLWCGERRYLSKLLFSQKYAARGGAPPTLI